MRAVPLVLALLVLPLLAGCLGGQGRTEWAYDDSGLDALRAAGRTGKGITIAVLDTGINTRHVALDHLVDDDPGNGQLVAFRDFLGNAAGPREAFDDEGHGTHVIGILAARGSSAKDKLFYDGIELRGATPQALLVVGRVCAQTCDARQLPAAIDWAVQQGADVISMSLGGQFNITDLETSLRIQQSINAALDAGVVVVSAAGNQGPSNPDVETPANLPGVIAVGAVDQAGQVAPFSSRGSAQANQCLLDPDVLPLPPLLPSLPGLPVIPQLPSLTGRCFPDQKPELVAPGVDILSAWTDDSYVRASGTSQATPFVTAAVALLLEGQAHLSSRQEVERLKLALVEGAQPVPGQVLPHDPASGYGVLDAAEALRRYQAV